MNLVIEAENLTKTFGRIHAVDGLNMAVAPGEVYGLIGTNGAGKSTTLRMVLDIVRPTSGKLRVLDLDPRTGGAALRRKIGYLPGELRLDDRGSGESLLRFFGSLGSSPWRQTVGELAERLGLDLTRTVRTLSKGNKQKLGIIQAFMAKPDLLILDEPTDGLDPLVQREFLAMVREAKEEGQTVLLSSHVLSEVQRAADKVGVVSNGRIVAEGPTESLRIASIRRVQMTAADATEAELAGLFARVPGISDLSVLTLTGGGAHVSATLRGDIDPLIKALASLSLLDLTIEEPDLEESVLTLYGVEAKQ